MARFYATFNNSTVSALEAASGSNYYQRKAFTNGTTLQTALVNARAALSSAVYAELTAGNRDGTLGRVIPVNAFTLDGSNLSWTNLYTNSAAEWPADPRVRPTAQITIANSTAVSPSDGGVVSQSLYTDATTALGNALAGIADGGPNGRIGLDPWRTLASLWHDHDLTYFAWDDFTPGTPQNITVGNLSSQSASSSFSVTLPWTQEYLADLAGSVRLFGRLDRSDGGGSQFTVFANNVIVSAGSGSASYTVTGGTLPAGQYQLTYRATFRDATITTHFGSIAEYISGVNFITLT